MRDFVPVGNYRLKVRDLRATLYCSACKHDGTWIPASLDLTFLEEANVANEDGYLVNRNGDVAQKGFLPQGSYLESTQEWRVILSGLCQKDDLTWQWCTIDITNFEIDTSISLKDGVFTAVTTSTN